MKIETLTRQWQPRRKIQGIAAALLPFRENGKVAVEAFQRHLLATQQAGLMNAVNMDTGHVHYLGESEKLEGLQWAREVLGQDVPFLAGAYLEGQKDEGEVEALYSRQI